MLAIIGYFQKNFQCFSWHEFTSVQLLTVQSDGHRISLLHDRWVFGLSKCWHFVVSSACSSDPTVWMQSTVLFFWPVGPHVVEHFCHSPAHHLKTSRVRNIRKQPTTSTLRKRSGTARKRASNLKSGPRYVLFTLSSDHSSSPIHRALAPASQWKREDRSRQDFQTEVDTELYVSIKCKNPLSG